MTITVEDVLEAFAYFIGYYEKKSASNLTRNKSDFEANKGSGNYTYMGKLCGINPGAWCAMMVSTAVYEACGNDKTAAKKALWGIWPYAACNQLYDAAPSAHKGRRGSWTPKAGDVIVFTDNGSTRTHTGMVYAVDSTHVYTYEGNSGDMCRKRSYLKTSTYIYGYVELNLDVASTSSTSTSTATTPNTYVAQYQKWLGVTADGEYGSVTKKAAIKAHQTYLNKAYSAGLTVDGVWGRETYYATQKVQKGDDNDDVKVWQGLLYCLGYDPVGLDGDFGSNTEKATMALQKAVSLNATGIADPYTWAKALGVSRPSHTTLRKGSKGSEVKYLQRLLVNQGYVVETDGDFGSDTEAKVKLFQTANGLTADGVVGSLTWAKIE